MNISPPYHAIIFDFDGVLVESVDIKAQAFYDLYKPYGQKIQEKVRDFHLKNIGMSRFEKFRHFHQHFLKKGILSPHSEQLLSEKFSNLVESQVIDAPYVKGALEFLQSFSSLIPCYVATATPEDESIRINAARGMTFFFQKIYGSPASKSDIIADILTQNNYSPSQTLMIGDSPSDLEAAQAHNIHFLGRKTKYSFPPNIPVIDDLTSLPSTLQLNLYEQLT